MIGGEVRHSIIRRSSAVTVAFLLGHALNYALMLAANRILGAAGFGIFYTSILIVNVVMAPMMALIFALGRALTELATIDRHAVAHITVTVLSRVLRFGLPGAIVAGLLLIWVSQALGLEAWFIGLLIPALALVLAATEVMRTGFQSLLLFRWSSALWIASQGAQFAVGAGLLFFTTRVWPGVLGIVIGAAVALSLFVPWFIREARGADHGVQWRFHIRQEFPLVVSYSLFVLISNTDILLAFLLLPRGALDVYAASALLPKAIVTATFPVAQIILPVIVERRAMGLPLSGSLLKGLGMVTALASIAFGCLWIILPLIQQSPVAIRGLDIGVSGLLAAAAVALSSVRLLVVAEMALQRHVLAAAQTVMVVLFVLVCSLTGVSPSRIATAYAVLGWALFFAALGLFPRRRSIVAAAGARNSSES